MKFSHYTENGAAQAAELVNLFAEGRQPSLDTIHTLVGDERIAADEMPAVTELAAELAAVFAAADPAGAMTAVNRLLDRTPVRPHVSDHDGEDPHLHYVDEDAGRLACLAAYTAMSLALTLCDDGVQRLCRCAAEGCERVFVDTSRNAQRRFCCEAHANRTHVARHRSRRRRTTTARS
jgi:predicted RNA-binding Zn ribbon-like protein